MHDRADREKDRADQEQPRPRRHRRRLEEQDRADNEHDRRQRIHTVIGRAIGHIDLLVARRRKTHSFGHDSPFPVSVVRTLGAGFWRGCKLASWFSQLSNPSEYFLHNSTNSTYCSEIGGEAYNYEHPQH